MTFWIFAILITLAAIVAVALPVYRKSRELDISRDGEYAHDVEVYRDQLRELSSDAERGIISEEDAKQARTEIARRLLVAEEKASAESNLRDERRHRFGSIVLASTVLVFIPALTFLVYSEVGSPHLEAQPLAPRVAALQEEQLARNQAREQMVDLVARAEEHLQANPDDGRGWDVLAPVYFRAGEPQKAIDAYRNAINLLGENAVRLSGLGEALFAVSSGIVTPEASQSFNRAIEMDANDGRARFYLALATLQTGAIEEGTQAWQQLASDESAEADWRGAAVEGLRRIQTGDLSQIPGMAQLPAVAGMPQLDAETIEQGAAMQPDDQAAMISGMVERLDARLREDPNDADGWQRLIRAYVVMGDRDNASDALERAIATFADDTEIATTLNQFATSLGLEPVQVTN